MIDNDTEVLLLFSVYANVLLICYFYFQFEKIWLSNLFHNLR